MQLPTNLTPAQRAAIVQCLRIAAARGRAIREAQSKNMPSSVGAQDGGDNGTAGNLCGIVPSIIPDETPRVKKATQGRQRARG